MGIYAILLALKGVKFLEVALDKLSVFLILSGTLILIGILISHTNKAINLKIKEFSKKHYIYIIIIGSIFFLTIPNITTNPNDTLKTAAIALKQNNVKKFAQHFSKDMREESKNIFKSMTFQEKIEFIKNLKTAELEKLKDGTAHYTVATVENGEKFVRDIYLRKDIYGVWKITSKTI